MGVLLAGTPAARLTTTVSLPLDLVSVLSLLHRAVPESHFDPWLVETRARLSPELRENLDLLHGFSGRLYYYVEEPVMRFRPLDPDRADASFETFVAFLLTLPAAHYQDMVASALTRVHQDLGLPAPQIDRADSASWRVALEPALTVATMGEVLALVMDPPALKKRTINLFVDVWEAGYRDDYEAHLPELQEAARLGQQVLGRDALHAFIALTDQQPPPALARRLGEVRRVAFCPSAHLGAFISYVLYPPDLVVDFGASEFIARAAEEADHPPEPTPPGALTDAALLEIVRALADPNRLRILAMLADGEQYAQEIVGRLGIAQSAVSRHLAQLERAGLIGVAPRGGSKYYSVNADALEALAVTFAARRASLRTRS
ncbi:MAG: winged helix-turn-helix transcriptional regulator [Thermomicrobiales bacterium]|nr:winged helix-turn-helix transcriptional regulator [Thermomicrobiales bacterium]